MHTRTAGPADVDRVTQLINTAFQVEHFFKKGERTSAAHVRELMGTGVILVVEDKDLGIVASAYTEITGDHVYVGMVSVEPGHQGRGLGRQIMTAAETHGRARGCRVADINVVNLRTELPPFYHRLGYVETGTRPFGDEHQATRACHLVTMAKPL